MPRREQLFCPQQLHKLRNTKADGKKSGQQSSIIPPGGPSPLQCGAVPWGPDVQKTKRDQSHSSWQRQSGSFQGVYVKFFKYEDP